jgi:glucose-6-phosphate 1-epimerase
VIKPCEVLGQPAMRLRAPDGAEATVLLHGAQLVSWIPAGDVERLYLSPLAVAGPGLAVRGGIPVVFPQFEQLGTLPRHGLVRTRRWTWLEGAERAGQVLGVLQLRDDEATRALWPHAFEVELTLSIAGLQLDVELAIRNSGESSFDFTAALHSYLRCDDLQRARLSGLYGTRYLDRQSGEQQQQEMDPQGFAGEIDRLYYDVGAPLSLSTAMGRMTIRAEGFPDVVLWNPGPHKAATLPDLPDDDWLRMLCVEAGAIGQVLTLAPGQEWVGRQGFEA